MMDFGPELALLESITAGEARSGMEGRKQVDGGRRYPELSPPEP